MKPPGLKFNLLTLLGVGSYGLCFNITPDLYSPAINTKLDNTSSYYAKLYPQITDHGNPAHWQLLEVDEWTSGFFPATMYEMYRRQLLCPLYSDGINWLGKARVWSEAIVFLQNGNSLGHDQGFVSLPFVYELGFNPQNTLASNALNNFAQLLADRFSPIVGCTRSWNSTAPDFEVVIDNMMNLDLLFVSSNLTGNTTLNSIAITHANTTMKNHFRGNYSTWHLLHYDEDTGLVTDKVTAQGYANWSTWSRGQSWAMHGYANMYNRTGFPEYLETSRLATKLFLEDLPSTNTPPWDFNAPANLATADTSAGAVAASAMIQLATIERSLRNLTGSAYYVEQAINILNGVSNLGWKPSWDSILSNGTSNYPANSSQTGIVYGDYYYVKSANDLIAYGFQSCDILASANPNSTSTSTASPSARTLQGSASCNGVLPGMSLCLSSLLVILVAFIQSL